MFDLIDPYIPSFLLGMLVAFILSWKIHRRHKQAWQKEYRRLMGGIDEAVVQLDMFVKINVKLSPNALNHTIKILHETYNGVSWPR